MQNLKNRLFIRPSEIQSVYGISRSTAYRLMALNQFPQLITLSPRCVGWSVSELDAYFGLIPKNAANNAQLNP